MTIDPTLFTDVDKLFEAYDKPAVPGCALAIIHEGEIIYKRGYGLANLEDDVPITPSTVFDIASVSKQFTAACALLLEGQGKLTLEDDIQNYLPELSYKKTITLRHLIHHTSGIPDYCVLMALAGMSWHNDYPEAQIIELIARQPLEFTPGKTHAYSNSGYFLLGEIIARVSGKSLDEFAKEHIFKPLGMNNTQFYDDHTRIIKNRAIGYTPTDNGFAIEHYKLDLVGDGAVHTTVEDLLLWDQNFYHNKLEGGQEFIEKMLTPSTLNSGKTMNYSCGLLTTTFRGQKLVWHNGGWAGYLSEFVRFPEQKLSIIMLTNRNDIPTSSLVLSLFKLLLADVLEADTLPSAPAEKSTDTSEPFEIPKEALNDYLGHYFSKQLNVTYAFTLDQDKLVLKFPYAKEGFVLESTGKHTFSNEVNLELKFLPNKQGEIRGLEIVTQRIKKIRFKKLK
jgi:CubicO group peptidase (beta-lactamase class C family)